MPDGPSPRELAELDELDAWNKAVRLRAIQTNISRELRSQYKLPKELPHRIFTLLMHLMPSKTGTMRGGAGLDDSPVFRPIAAYLNLTTELSE